MRRKLYIVSCLAMVVYGLFVRDYVFAAIGAVMYCLR